MANNVKIDVVTIFPDYVLTPLAQSLIGKAGQSGLVNITTHDLRDFATDNHRTVDDTPYGGGAGMVMMPTVWGEAIDAISQGSDSPSHELIILTPAGELFSQSMAQELSCANHIIFACGRYEGIDQRVTEHYRTRSDFRVREVSIGNYVLNGGEVAALVMIEAIVRLVPGVIGNPDSLTEESHSITSDNQNESLLEYPMYTKPSEWRGLSVPAILTSGNHGLIASWRREQAIARTRQIRPETGE